MERVFDAFYTTKPEGMGMGLAICQTIVSAHGGRLWASANEPFSTVFQFTLPVEQEETTSRRARSLISAGTSPWVGCRLRQRRADAIDQFLGRERLAQAAHDACVARACAQRIVQMGSDQDRGCRHRTP